jgi:ABC-type multidrug transport system fused ATPase/permease subunit
LIKQEPTPHDEYELPPQWPEHGRISVKNLKIRYANDLPLVLKGISFEVNAAEKIAVVGRTGAGKSTLSLALFRIVPFAEGSIFIDGVDISRIPLQQLRSKLTIIPQDPVLFNGSLRSNLDPQRMYTDRELWETLERTHFFESFKNSKDDDLTISRIGSFSLDMPVADNGSNFSLGQRQLLCLARSLLQGNKIIFLDEATASVDAGTDAHIQATIRSEFSNNTIITIAHRVRTIIDYDRVLVLSKGEVVEFGSPLELLKNENGIFHHMCQESGEYQELYELACNPKT